MRLLSIFLIFFQLFLTGQIIINHTHMPQAGSSYYVFTDQNTNISPSLYEPSGENLSWNFTSFQSSTGKYEVYVSSTSSQIPSLCLAVFNNPFDPAYKSTHAKQVENFSDPMGNIQVEQVFQMFQLNQHVYVFTGQTAIVNGVPVCIKNTPPDTIYKFPLKYGDTIKSSSKYFISLPGIGYFEQTWQRTTVVDAWGYITTPYKTYEALRLFSFTNFVDSIFYESYNFGIKIPHQQKTYIWMSDDEKYPVFIIEKNITNFNSSTNIYWLGVNLNSISNNTTQNILSIFPSLSADYININNIYYPIDYLIYDCYGNLVKKNTITSENDKIWIGDLPNGVYLLKQSGQPMSKYFLKIYY